jgi:hypothetical protein
MRRDGGGYAGDLGRQEIGIFFQKGLDTLFGDLPVGRQPVKIQAAGTRPHVWSDATSASFADAFDLFIDLGILSILLSNGVVARHRGP